MFATLHHPLRHSDALQILAQQFGEVDVGLREELANAGVLTVHLPCEAEIWIGVDQLTRPPKSRSSLKVLVVLEPPDVKTIRTDGFDLILTWQQAQLRDLGAVARFFVSSSPWLVPAEWSRDMASALSKEAAVGFLRGAKRTTEGHRLRHELWDARDQLAERMKVPLRFVEGGGVDRTTRNRQFDCQFVVVIENSKHENYFTEKLLDALLSRCVPIYWGCPNIGFFFDASAILQVSDVGLAGIEALCEDLHGADYANLAGAIERNFVLAKAYAGDFGQRVERAVHEHLPGIRPASDAAEAPTPACVSVACNAATVLPCASWSESTAPTSVELAAKTTATGPSLVM